jgi:hypothetical protein
MKPLILLTALLLILTTASAQHKYNPYSRKYPTVGMYRSYDTVSIYNRVFVLRTYAYAKHNGGKPAYKAQALNSPDKKLVKGGFYEIWESEIKLVRKGGVE